MRIAVFASGSGTNFEAIALEKYNNIEIALMITDNPNAYAIERSKKLNIPYKVFNYKDYESKELYEKAILKVLNEFKIDFIVLAGYMRIVGDTLLSCYENKIINIHPALLPSFKGKSGIQDAYNYGVKIMGITIHYVSKELDSGKIIAQDCFFVLDKTLEEAETEIHKLEHKLYPKVLKDLFER